MTNPIQTQEIRCPVCNHGRIVFLFDNMVKLGADPLIIGIRCVSFDTSILSGCSFPKNSRMFELISTLHYLSVKHSHNIDKINKYTQNLHVLYADDIAKMMFKIYSELKALDEERSVDSKS